MGGEGVNASDEVALWKEESGEGNRGAVQSRRAAGHRRSVWGRVSGRGSGGTAVLASGGFVQNSPVQAEDFLGMCFCSPAPLRICHYRATSL